MPFEWLKFAHVVTIIAAVALAEGSILPTLVAARRRDVVGIRSGISVGELGEKFANPLAVVSIGFGIAAALAGQIDLTASWLVATYLLLAGAIGMAVLGGFKHLERLKEAALASPVEAPSSELVALIDHRWTWIVSVWPPVTMGLIIYLMVVKPTLW